MILGLVFILCSFLRLRKGRRDREEACRRHRLICSWPFHRISIDSHHSRIQLLLGFVFFLSSPIRRSGRFGDEPSLIQSLHHLLWQGTLFQIGQVGFQLGEAADADDDPVCTAAGLCRCESRSVLGEELQLAMVHAPSQRGLQQGQLVLLGHGLDQSEALERLGGEVAVAVHLAQAGGRVAVAALVGDQVGGLVFAGEEAAR